MKSRLLTACATGAMLLAAPSFAQSVIPNLNVYGTLGYSNLDSNNGADLSGITGRLGVRPSPYFGAEGEVTVGVGQDQTKAAFGSLGQHLNDSYAGYVVGYLPLKPNLDLFARAGFGHSDFHTSFKGVGFDNGADSWNFGAGGQYFFDHVNGVRAEYTRDDYVCSHCTGADVWTVSFVQKF